MIDTERLANLNTILALTQKMHASACESAWEILVALESQRSVAIKSFFALPSVPEETHAIRQTLEQVMALDKEIYAMARHQRDQIGRQLNELSKNRNAASAYLKNAR